MKYFFILSITLLAIQDSVAPPVTKEETKERENEIEETEELGLEYERYLQEVVSALESDVNFKKKLESANESDIRSGKIANDLELVSHNIRTKLDELKRQEIVRLNELYNEERRQQNEGKSEHLDHKNPHTFEIHDLKKLIAKVTKDLDEIDKKRREKFKEYEMHKQFEREEKMKNMTEDAKKEYEKKIHEFEKKHKEHEPLHHPGSKKQLEEVWEKQDHMETQDFDPRTFFYRHDVDGNGVWDENELKALFIQEIRKMYEEGQPEDDINERAEELERMREHVFKEADTNRDRFISLDEFLTQSKKAEFETDPGWEPLDQQQLYSEQEYELYKQQQLQKAISRGMSQEFGGHMADQHQFPPHPNQIPQHGYAQQPGQYQYDPQQQHYPQQGQYANQMPPSGQFNPQGYQQIPQHGQYANQMPPSGQFNPQGYQQKPEQGQYGHQIPQQQQYYPNSINQGPPQHNVYPNQQLPVGHVPPQQPQYHPNDVNQPQYHPNDVNQGLKQQNMNINQQLPIGQVPPQQTFQQPQVVLNGNQVPNNNDSPKLPSNQPSGSQQTQQMPAAPQQQNQQNTASQQQNQQVPVANNVNQQASVGSNINQQVPPSNNINQPPQPPQQNQPSINAVPGSNQKSGAPSQSQH